MKLVKWLIVTCALVLVTFAGVKTGFLPKILSMDTTFITTLILSVFVLAHFTIPYMTTNWSSKLEDEMWFVAEALVSVGMIGTVVGFTMLFGEAFITVDTSDPVSMSNVISDIAMGMGTALITTLAGLVCSLTLKAELVFIGANHD